MAVPIRGLSSAAITASSESQKAKPFSSYPSLPFPHLSQCVLHRREKRCGGPYSQSSTPWSLLSTSSVYFRSISTGRRSEPRFTPAISLTLQLLCADVGDQDAQRNQVPPIQERSWALLPQLTLLLVQANLRTTTFPPCLKYGHEMYLVHLVLLPLRRHLLQLGAVLAYHLTSIPQKRKNQQAYLC